MTIEGSVDKLSITGAFDISFDRNFLPGQLIQSGKTTQCLPRFEIPKDFSLSTKLRNFSNTDESLKFLKEVINSYAIKQRRILTCSADQKGLVITDVLTGQTTKTALDVFKETKICIVSVSANLTKFDGQWLLQKISETLHS